MSMNEESADDHHKSVYAHFGLALYLAQVLEYGLANALMLTKLLPTRTGRRLSQAEWEKAVDSFMGRQFELTLGQLITDLKVATDIPRQLGDRLAVALKKRNFLAHHYFKDGTERFGSVEGRNLMIEELESCQQIFLEADDLLERTIDPLQKRYGITPEMIQTHVDAYIAEFAQS